jgi:hypothetical protein
LVYTLYFKNLSIFRLNDDFSHVFFKNIFNNYQMKIILVIFILILPYSTSAHSVIAFEGGVGFLKGPQVSASAASFAFRTAYEVDSLVSFFGLMGWAQGEDGSDRLEHRQFAGGIAVNLLPSFDLGVGFSLNVWEERFREEITKDSNLSPMMQMRWHQNSGIWDYGASLTMTGVSRYHAFAARLFLGLVF